mmetsp:Transcript_106152/g.285491  ORF Transcript_106152/g.285491 Transcript_106152/m.285491 type:complete len:484 (-) Transcript_106152:46-1497(-)
MRAQQQVHRRCRAITVWSRQQQQHRACFSATCALSSLQARRRLPEVAWRGAGGSFETLGISRRGLCIATDTSAQMAGAAPLGLGNDMLRHIAEHSQQPFSKYSLEDLLRLQEFSPEERVLHLDSVLHVGISKIVLLLQDLPLGFTAQSPIREVIQDYVQDLRDLRKNPPEDPARFQECILAIFARHRGMLGQIARGLREFQQEISESFLPVADLKMTRLADLSATVPAVQKIERALDEFFTIRTTLRLLIAHCLQLNPEDPNTSEIGHAMHELMQRIPNSNRSDGAEMPQVRQVGAICLDTRPSLILIEAYRHAQFMCRRRFDKDPPELMVNGMPAHEFLAAGFDTHVDNHFPYVDIHLYFVFFEVLKNALLTSMRKTGPDGECKPIHASLISGTSLNAENERTVKITDHGEGISREEMRKVWSYFHSTTKTKDPREQESAGFSTSGGRGLGLAVSRVLVRYFGGEIDLHSIPRKGTDVYIYL